MDLPDGRGQVLGSGDLIEQSRRHAEGELVGIADAIAADVSIGATQFDQLKSGIPGIENRQLVLISVRHIAIDQARLQRLRALPLRARVPLEYQSRVEARVRERCGWVCSDRRRRHFANRIG